MQDTALGPPPPLMNSKPYWYALAMVAQAAVAIPCAGRRAQLLGLSCARTAHFLAHAVLTSTGRAAVHHLGTRHGMAGDAGQA